MNTAPNTFSRCSYYCIFWATALTPVANNPLGYGFPWHRICLRRLWAALPGMWAQGQQYCPSPSPCRSQDLPMESASLSNCGNRHSEPKPSSADGSKMHGSGQPTKPKIPPCKSFALSQSFWLGNHPIDRWSFQTIPGPPAWLIESTLFFSLGNLFDIAPSTGRLVILKLLLLTKV